MIRAYRYRAFPPPDLDAIEAFDRAIAMKRVLWDRLVAIHLDHRRRGDALFAADPEWSEADRRLRSSITKSDRHAAREALRKATKAVMASRAFAENRKAYAAEVRRARRSIAAAGLHWGDYNAVIFQFRGAAASSAHVGATPGTDADVMGEAVVNQLQGGRSPTQLLADSATWIEYIDNTGHAAKRKPGSRRSKYRRARLSLTLRGPKNPLGPMTMAIEFVMHRPLPPGSRIQEVRIIRRRRSIVTNLGEIGGRAQWFVIFICRSPVLPTASRKACGLAFTWTTALDDEDQPFAITCAAAGVHEYDMLMRGHNKHWRLLREARAELQLPLAPDAPIEMRRKAVELEIEERRLRRRRTHVFRHFAAALAARYGTVAMQDLSFDGLGAKMNTAPAECARWVRHAVEAAGGVVVTSSRSRRADGLSAEELAEQLFRDATTDVRSRGIVSHAAKSGEVFDHDAQ